MPDLNTRVLEGIIYSNEEGKQRGEFSLKYLGDIQVKTARTRMGKKRLNWQLTCVWTPLSPVGGGVSGGGEGRPEEHGHLEGSRHAASAGDDQRGRKTGAEMTASESETRLQKQ